ncbi:MAG: CDP-glucose 4,6-dehydratase [Polyangiaceae bacterium]
MVANADFWRGKRVLITGHTGFKGAWLSLWLGQLGADVAGYALPPPSVPSLFQAAALAQRMRSITSDVRDLAAVRAAFQEVRPEIVLHLAAQALVRPSYEDPVATFDTNVMGTVNVLEAARQQPETRSVVVVTSDKCYENREWPWGYRENEAMGGHDPYSSSKGCAELVTAAYRSSFAKGTLGIASARAGNVIGGGDWAKDRIIPDFVRAVTQGQALRVRNPGAVRPWQHVLEPLAGYLLLAQRLFDEPKRFAEGWNFGPVDTDARPVSWVVERFARNWGQGVTWQADPGPHPHEANFLKLDCSQARNLLAWRPRLTLDQALSWVTDWYREFSGGSSALELCLSQIAAFEAITPE